MWQEETQRVYKLTSEELIDQLHHPDKRLRGYAARELGRRKETKAINALVELLKDNKDVWSGGTDAAIALGDIGDARAIEPLIFALANPYIGGLAVQALVKIHDDKAIPSLIALFERTSAPSLATVLGNWGDTRAVEPLIIAMGHPHPHVRFYVARALGKLGDERAIPALKQAQENDVFPITDTKSLRGKSVSYVAGKAIESIRATK